ncbi:MAG TPA: (d)CMP kinase [Bacillota bacterium]|nr:(d)CMP kinase [Bacillota bacterium]HOA15577.1 (d)CMP kinase [Bacillota bacterium]
MPLKTSIAIDGPAGSGKSTIAKMLSKATGLPYLSTGEMYRAIALCTLRAGIDPYNEQEVLDCALRSEISATPDGNGGFKVYCGKEDVTGLLRTPEVSKMSSPVAIHAGVRKLMVSLQRAIAAKDDVIMDGRDIGTVVLKESDRKIYLDASVEVRARRRLMDFKDSSLTFEQVLKDLKERDMRDSTREVDPLRPAEDAFIIDTSDMTPQQVVEAIMERFGMKAGEATDA